MSQADHQRKRQKTLRIYFALPLAAAGVAVAACGPASTGTAGAGTGTAAAAAAPKPLTCKQQYQKWRTGPANADGRKLQADAEALSKAGEDIPVMVSDIKALGADAAALEAYPMPACADPAGYWQQYLTAIKAAGDNAGSATGLGALLLAAAPLKNVAGIQARLSAELEKMVGIKAAVPAPQAPVAAPTLPTVAPATMAAPSPLPTLATVAPVAIPSPSLLPTLPTIAPSS